MMAKNDTEPSLKQLQWLLERITAGRDPITRQQVEAFGRHPGGPILPNECIAVERLPVSFGMRREALPPRLMDIDVPVNGLTVSPGDGSLWVATVINGESVLRCFGRYVGTPEHEEPSNALRCLTLRADGDGARYFSPRIVGFQYGTPVVRLEMHQMAWADDAFIFIGGKRAFADQLPTQRIVAINVTPDGSVLTAHPVSRDRWVIYRNGEEVLGTDRVVSAIWEIEDDIMWTCGPHGGLYAYALRAPMSRQGVRKIAHEQDIRDVFMRDGALCYVTTGSDGRGARLHRRSNGENFIQWNSDGHTYLRGFEEFSDGHTAYIGETVRDKRECWVVDGVAGPGFVCVTGLVFREGRAHYWGVLGRHLYTMELPGVTSKE